MEHGAAELRLALRRLRRASAYTTVSVLTLAVGMGVAASYGTEPYDAPTLAAVSVFVFATVLTASWIPARRASHMDPVRALRAE